MVDYAFNHRMLDHLRTLFYTLLNVDNFWSLAATWGSYSTEDPPKNAIPEKAGVDQPGVEPGSWFAYITSFFRPAGLGNHAATELELQRPKEHFFNFLFTLVFYVLYVSAQLCA